MKKTIALCILLAAIDTAHTQVPTTGLQMWYKADAGFTSSTWTDQSGNGNNLIAEPFGNAPTQLTEGGRKYIRFTTNTLAFPPFQTVITSMRKSSGIVWPATSTGTTVFMVFKTLVVSANAGLTLLGNPTISFLKSSNSTQAAFTTATVANLFTLNSNTQIGCGVFTPNSSTGNQLYINGTLINQVPTTGLSAATAVNNIEVTSGGSPGTNTLDVYEILVYSTPLTATDRQLVQTYLAGKYSVTLPLTLVGFKATRQAKNVLLQWQTKNESAMSGFEIEQSNNGKDFEKAGSVAPNNVSTGNTYSFTDESKWEKEQKFYRLKMINSDRTFSYSTVITLRKESENHITLYPNPVINRLNIIGSNSADNAGFKIIDSKGAMLLKGHFINTNSGIDVSSLARGTYWIELTLTNKVECYSFIKE